MAAHSPHVVWTATAQTHTHTPTSFVLAALPLRETRRVLRKPKPRGPAGFKTGVVTTGNSLTYSEADMAAMQGSGAAVKEMEAAAVAAVCRDLAAPMFAIKAVTDLVDGEHPPQEEFLANLARAVAALTEAMTASLDWMSGKTLADL